MARLLCTIDRAISCKIWVCNYSFPHLKNEETGQMPYKVKLGNSGGMQIIALY